MELQWEQTGERAVTAFRRFVIVTAEVMQILSMIFCTLIGGLVGAASGGLQSSMFGIGTSVHIQGLGEVATVGSAVGFLLGAIVGFVLSATVAALLFAFAQIERNTRSLNETGSPAHPTPYREAPRF